MDALCGKSKKPRGCGESSEHVCSAGRMRLRWDRQLKLAAHKENSTRLFRLFSATLSFIHLGLDYVDYYVD